MILWSLSSFGELYLVLFVIESFNLCAALNAGIIPPKVEALTWDAASPIK